MKRYTEQVIFGLVSKMKVATDIPSKREYGVNICPY